ncbi:glutaredoxin family protein [Cellvibrio polysaccharolyticus]|uniref:Glutaredoxin family protein n=1 Tax=Cellvibrio polysaccharolyticus TaxID=2082724 RepID=A0A928YTX1_9GAMM|nr:glutaredoxin family protein [Cellvibrio polysaccharolyticus]MBE8717449.1 glutaredoxin family protein [Cellvibrio polysaccharolyticus]
MTVLTLYSTLGCHLCENAKQVLWPVLSEAGLQLQEVDIADDDHLQEQYAIRIPVIRLQNATEDVGWPFDGDDVRRYLERQK